MRQTNKLTNRQIADIINEFKKVGIDVKVGDIAYVLLCDVIESEKTAYKTIFGNVCSDDDIMAYDNSAMIKTLKKKLKKARPVRVSDNGEEAETEKEGKKDFSFEQNKDELIKRLEENRKKYLAGDIAYKDYSNADITIRKLLNDKFGVQDEGSDQYIIVQPKFNHVCEWTRKECFLQTKEYAMQKWDLVERSEIDKLINNKQA